MRGRALSQSGVCPGRCETRLFHSSYSYTPTPFSCSILLHLFFILFYDSPPPGLPPGFDWWLLPRRGFTAKSWRPGKYWCKFTEYSRFKVLHLRKGSGVLFSIEEEKVLQAWMASLYFFILSAMGLTNRNQSELACCISPFHFNVGSVSVMCTVLKRVQRLIYNYFCHRHMGILLMFLCSLWLCTLFVYKAFTQTRFLH